MDRRTFTRSCFGCVGAVLLSPMLSSCQSTHYATGTVEQNGLSILKSEFAYVKKDHPTLRQYIIVRNDNLEFPIYLYRFSDNEYSAVLMRCTHQGNELSASGDHLTCSAHGSEFNSRGIVAQGPAEKNLRSFNVKTDGDKILIDLRA
jgi:Rieske Fe-S protein